MSRWPCKCGHAMRDGGDASPCFLIAPRLAIEDLIEIAESGNPRRQPSPELIESARRVPELWVCPACGLMNVIRDGVTVEYWRKEPA